MDTTDVSTRFDTDYWTSASVYSKYKDYATALDELRGFTRGLLRRVLRHAPRGGRHVDAGCGHGAIVHELLSLGWDSRGFDASGWMIELAQHHAPALADLFATGELPDVPFEGEFDLITCFQVVEHIEDPVPAIRALGARLSSGGRLALTTPNLNGHVPFWPDPLVSDPTHVCVHEPNWWAGAVRAAGLSVVHVDTQMAVPLVWRLHPALAVWLPLGKRIGPDVLVIGERR